MQHPEKAQLSQESYESLAEQQAEKAKQAGEEMPGAACVPHQPAPALFQQHQELVQTSHDSQLVSRGWVLRLHLCSLHIECGCTATVMRKLTRTVAAGLIQGQAVKEADPQPSGLAGFLAPRKTAQKRPFSCDKDVGTPKVGCTPLAGSFWCSLAASGAKRAVQKLQVDRCAGAPSHAHTPAPAAPAKVSKLAGAASGAGACKTLPPQARLPFSPLACRWRFCS